LSQRLVLTDFGNFKIPLFGYVPDFYDGLKSFNPNLIFFLEINIARNKTFLRFFPTKKIGGDFMVYINAGVQKRAFSSLPSSFEFPP